MEEVYISKIIAKVKINIKFIKFPIPRYLKNKKITRVPESSRPRFEFPSIKEPVKKILKKLRMKNESTAMLFDGGTVRIINANKNQKKIVKSIAGKTFFLSLTSFCLFIIFFLAMFHCNPRLGTMGSNG